MMGDLVKGLDFSKKLNLKGLNGFRTDLEW